MKLKLASSVLALAALFGAAGLSGSAAVHADDYGRDRDRGGYGGNEQRYHRRRSDHGFGMGLCVGQVLAQAGVILPLPLPQPGQPGSQPTPDPTTEAAFKSAIQQCRAQLNGQGTVASPAPAPSAAPTSAPTTAPIENPTPDTSSSASS